MISQSGVPILDAQLTTVPLEKFAIKLNPIVRDADMRNPKLSDNIFPHKSLGIYILDIC